MNSIFGWISLGVAAFGLLCLVAALYYYLRAGRDISLEGEMLKARDGAVISGLVLLIFAIVAAVIWVMA